MYFGAGIVVIVVKREENKVNSQLFYFDWDWEFDNIYIFHYYVVKLDYKDEPSGKLNKT
jgi:hypothetical protein